MSAQHTPGPWVLGNENNSNAEVCIGNTDMVASLCRESSYTSQMTMTREEMLANAHLIAAAPDLIQALEELVACSEYESVPSWASQWDIARTAINKAKGIQ